jgi:exosortase/archaeosortase family protein
MLVVFFALSTAVAMLMRKPLGERVVVALSALPIALVSNILRITVTGLLHDTAGREVADAVFHDLAGWLMMPLALAFLGLELKLLKHLLIEPDRKPVATPPRPELPLPRATLPPLAARRSRRQAQAQRQPAPFAGRSLTKR